MPKWLGVLILVTLTGCATTNVGAGLQSVRAGMDKDKVLETAGNPRRTFREASQDHWIYTYFQDNLEYRRDVIFEDGKVVKLSRPLAREDWMKDLERATTMEEFEHKAREHNKRAGQFKPVDGSSEETQGN